VEADRGMRFISRFQPDAWIQNGTDRREFGMPLGGMPRWTTAIGLVAVATVSNFWIISATGGRALFLPFFPAILLAGFLGDLAPGLLSLILSLAVVDYFALEPARSLQIARHTDWLALVMCAIAGGSVLVLSVTARRLLLEARNTRRRLQEALSKARDVERRFEAALKVGSIIAWACDGRRRYTWMYMAHRKCCVDCIGRAITDEYPPEKYPEYTEAIDHVWATGEGKRLSVAFEHDGELRHFFSTIEPVKEENGRVVGLVGASMDTTELHQAQESVRASEAALREADRRKDEFVAMLAHELRNPMAPIRYAAEILKNGVSDKALQHARTVIERQSAHMTRLLDDLLDMSRVTRNVVELRRSRLDLCALLTDVVEMARPQLTEVHHRLLLSLPPGPVIVHGDPARLQQIFGNLIDNAAKYTPRGGRIEIRAETRLEHVIVDVTDTGIGLTAEMLPRVFDLFSQLHKPCHGKGGLGIGLTVVKRIVELHGGSIQVNSEGLNRGARFTVGLPLVSPLEQPGPVEVLGRDNVVPLYNSQPRILVVDDNQDATETLSALLRLDGFSVRVAYSGSEALMAFEEVQPAVVLLDMGLPDMDGAEVARRIRSRPDGGKVRLIAITGWGQEADRRRTRAAGIDAHLVKPVDPRQLLELLARESPRLQTG
jgi:signal transduction histidine kinase/CheY-like chemotaxis protein